MSKGNKKKGTTSSGFVKGLCPMHEFDKINKYWFQELRRKLEKKTKEEERRKILEKIKGAMNLVEKLRNTICVCDHPDFTSYRLAKIFKIDQISSTEDWITVEYNNQPLSKIKNEIMSLNTNKKNHSDKYRNKEIYTVLIKYLTICDPNESFKIVFETLDLNEDDFLDKDNKTKTCVAVVDNELKWTLHQTSNCGRKQMTRYIDVKVYVKENIKNDSINLKLSGKSWFAYKNERYGLLETLKLCQHLIDKYTNNKELSNKNDLFDELSILRDIDNGTSLNNRNYVGHYSQSSYGCRDANGKFKKNMYENNENLQNSTSSNVNNIDSNICQNSINSINIDHNNKRQSILNMKRSSPDGGFENTNHNNKRQKMSHGFPSPNDGNNCALLSSMSNNKDIPLNHNLMISNTTDPTPSPNPILPPTRFMRVPDDQLLFTEPDAPRWGDNDFNHQPLDDEMSLN